LNLGFNQATTRPNSTAGETQISHCFTFQWASNEVKISGHKPKVDLLPIRPMADLIIANCWRVIYIQSAYATA